MTHEELLMKAKAAKSAEDLIALAKENDMELTEESAKAYFAQIQKNGELDDDELDNVSGGWCYHDGNRVVTPLSWCTDWKCAECGSSYKQKEQDSTGCYLPICATPEKHSGKFIPKSYCSNCKYYKYDDALCLCTYHH